MLLRKRRRGTILPTAEHEWAKFAYFTAIEDALVSVFEYIETFDNTKRIHQTLGHKTRQEPEVQRENTIAM